MTLLWVDGFDTYNPSDNSQVYLYQGAYDLGQGSNATNNTPYVRTGAQALSNFDNAQGSFHGWIGRNVGNLRKAWIGAAIYPFTPGTDNIGGIGLGNSPASNPWSQGGLGAGGQAVLIQLKESGQVSVVNSWDTGGGQYYQTGITTGSPISFNTYQYIEMFLDMDAAICQVWLNGNEKILEITGYPFPGDMLYFNHGLWGQHCDGSTAIVMDDIYLDSTTQQGAQRAYTLFPAGDESGNQWTLSGGTTGFSLIDSPAYNTGNYIQGASVGAESAFSMGQLPMTNAVINGMRLTSIEGLATSGSATTHKSVVIGANTYQAADVSPDTTPTTYDAMFNTSGITVPQVNSMIMSIVKDS